ncbi:MAG: hypothetical protein JW910_16730 [Anaerolineae bacterium]|nr:hypothetical protein [Anaerolineae bacterium]
MAEPTEYPDVLGAITGGPRLMLNSVHCAVGVHPLRVMVRQPFELLVLLQSAIDQPQDIALNVRLPPRTPDGQPLQFAMPKNRIRLRLGPGEVGLLRLPVVPHPPTPPARGYPALVQIEVHAPRRARQVRPPRLGEPPTALRVSVVRLNVLKEIGFAADGQGNQARIRFDVEPGTVQTGPLSLQDHYEVLWTKEDMQHEAHRTQEAVAAAEHLVLHFARDAIYDAVEAATLERFAQRGVELFPGEALFLTKTLCYIYEDALQTERGFTLHDGRWFQWLTKIVARTPEDGEYDVAALAAGELYLGALYDAVRVTMPIIELHARRRYGKRKDHDARAERMFLALQGEAPLTLEDVYMPLVLVGVTLNMNIYRQFDDLWGNLDQIAAAMEGRRKLGISREMQEYFKVLENLIGKEEELLRRSRVPRHEGL